MKAQVAMKLILIGLLSLIDFSASRAVNISNTWTLPQPGFNVFYRYFRDKISWFEADAVCQFHHANLVTVENIEQFDAAREFLKELDISEYVWIGLMRPTNADQFSWTNSKPLPVSEGYWAEPWPVAETPLCAIIDPARDYRWHALRCGGPETAAFLCEMEIPDWALHCTENPEITVQYISDSGAVQLSRHCQDSVKEISCQGKMTQMAMYDELKCPEEETSTTPIEITTVEILSTTTEESRPEVIIKNPQKMLEDVFNSVDDTNLEIDSNRLDFADAKKELDLMVGDQPVEDTAEDKKSLLKLAEKKEAFPKKSKNAKKEKLKVMTSIDEEQMMGDAPAEEVHNEQSTTVSSTKPEGSTTDRQRRDIAETTLSTDTKVTTEDSQISDASTTEDSSTVQAELTTEAQQITTVIIEETTTKNIVQGHPLFHNHAIFKEPISVDNNNGTLERKDMNNNDDHFIPPMLLVKARFTATKSTEGATEETKEMTTDITTSMITESTLEGQTVTDDDKNVTSKPTETNEISTNEIGSVTQVETTPALTSAPSEKPILIEKRNDPRVGLNAATTSIQPLSTVVVQASTTEAQSPSTTEESSTTPTEEISSSVSYESTASEISTTELQTETSETSESSPSESSPTKLSEIFTSTTQPEVTAERLIESTTEKTEMSSSPSVSATPITVKLTTLKMPEVSAKPINKSSKQMRNDIDEDPHGHTESHEHGSSEEGFEHRQQHLENNLNNEDNYQPYKPNRHRSQLDHSHHGPGFTIGKILG